MKNYSVEKNKFNVKTLGILILIMTLIMSCAAVDVFGAASAPAKPKIISIKSPAAGAFTVMSNKNSGIKGYQLRYSTSKKFNSYKNVGTTGARLTKSLKNLKKGKVYYVKIRSYKMKSGKKVYSKWSDVKQVTTRGNVLSKGTYYASKPTINLHTKTRTGKEITVWYNTKVTIVSSTVSTSGVWYKVKIGSSSTIYYLWMGWSESKLSKKNALNYDFVGKAETQYQKEVVEGAMSWLDKTTAYDFDKNESDGVKRNGKYTFHCSGLATYVVNTVMQKYAPPYRLNSNMDTLYGLTNILNDGIKGEINAKSFAKGSPDFDALKPGDLVFFKQNAGSSRTVDHVAIYIGNKLIVESTKACKDTYSDNGLDQDGGVCIAPLIGVYERTYVRAMRVLPATVNAANIEAKVKSSAKIYSVRECTSGTDTDSLSAGDTVTIMYTYDIGSTQNAYVSYTRDGSTKTHYGYVYKCKDKLKY